MSIDFSYRPRFADLKRLGGPAEAEIHIESTGDELEAVKKPRRSPPERFEGRTGYASGFLGFDVNLPTPLGRRATDVLEVEGTDGSNRLDYQHFSVVMSASRRMAMFVAVNIDGENAVKVSRSPPDKWFLDGRIPDAAQIGEDLYVGNILDRGHLVRREDPNWGTAAIASVANDDTFHFTNCSPQAANFNQRTWLSLEEYLLRNAKVQDAKICVFTGPVLRENDRKYRGVQIPTAYWKVIAFVNDAGKPSATAYLVDQAEELKELEATFGTFKTYQRSVKAIERLSGLSFEQLSDFDGFSNEELATRTEIRAELRSPADIRV